MKRLYPSGQRGASVLTALIFVAILGGIAAGVQYFSPPSMTSINSDTQSASVIALLPPGAPTTGATAPTGQKQQCTPGYDYKVVEKSGKPDVQPKAVCPKQSNIAPTQIKSASVTGAMMAAAAVPAAPGTSITPGTFGEINDPDRCQMNTTNGRYEPKTDFKCKVQYCLGTGANEKCKESDSGVAGGDSIDGKLIKDQLQNPLVKDILKTDGPQALNKLGLDTNAQQALRQAFGDDETKLKPKIDLAQKDADNAQRELDNLTAACHMPDGGAVSCGDVPAAEKKLSDAQKQLENLQAESDRLKSAQSVLNPNTSDPNSLTPCMGTGCTKPDQTSTLPGDNKQNCPGGPGCPGGEYTPKVNCPGGVGCPGGEYTPKPRQQPGPQTQTFPPAQQAPAGGGTQQSSGGAGGGLGGGLGSGGGGSGNAMQQLGRSLGQLLGQVLGGGSNTAQKATCSSDQTQYNQQMQQYQTQLQQYQYQQQQYQYQQQLQQYYGNTNSSSAPQPAAPAQPCYEQKTNQYGTGTNGQACTMQAPTQPTYACPTNYVWVQVSANNNGCVTGWQCVSNGTTPTSTTPGATPTAQLSCQPQLADVGMSIAISYACSVGTSTGAGFSTGGVQAGTANTTISNPPAGANTATYGLQCDNAGVKATAQCAVQIARPSIVLVANPRSVQSGKISSIGWLTSGMSSCVVSSPDMADFTTRNASYTSVNGVATTSPITASTMILLRCTTMGGAIKEATTTVTLLN